AVLPHGLASWNCHRGRVQLRYSEMDPEIIVDLARYFSSLCADPDSDVKRLQAIGKRLYDILIGPLSDRLEGVALVIDSDDELGNVPFEAFSGPAGYLASSFQIVQTPAVLSARAHQGKPISRSSRALIVGSTANVIDEQNSLLPIPDVNREAEAVAQKFHTADVLLGSKATKPNIRMLLPKTEVFHFVGHALADVRHEGLLLAPSSLNEYSDIWTSSDNKQQLFRRSQLAVLSACSTGRGNRGRREIYGDLVRAMLRAGV